MVSNAPYTVVVADDEDELREAVCTMIPWQELGFRLVGSAGNGLDALQLVEEREPDLLLTDIRMPFISGIELARQVREVRPMTHIAFLSGYDDFEYAQKAIQYNIISYMLKPLTIKGLGEELQVIRRKIDAQFAMFCQVPGQSDGQEPPAAMLAALVLDSHADLDKLPQADEYMRQCGLPGDGAEKLYYTVMVFALLNGDGCFDPPPPLPTRWTGWPTSTCGRLASSRPERWSRCCGADCGILRSICTFWRMRSHKWPSGCWAGAAASA